MEQAKRKAESDLIDERDTKRQRTALNNINDLPIEVVTRILVFIQKPKISRGSEFVACRLWSKIASQQEFWRLKCIRCWGEDIGPNIAHKSSDGSIEFDSSKFYWPVIKDNNRTLLDWRTYFKARDLLHQLPSTLSDNNNIALFEFEKDAVFKLANKGQMVPKRSKTVLFLSCCYFMEILLDQQRHEEAYELLKAGTFQDPEQRVTIRLISIAKKLEEKGLLDDHLLQTIHGAFPKIKNMNDQVKVAFKHLIGMFIRSAKWLKSPDPDSRHAFGLDLPFHKFEFSIIHHPDGYEDLVAILQDLILEAYNGTQDKEIRLAALTMACFATIRNADYDYTLENFNDNEVFPIQKPFLNKIFSLIGQELARERELGAPLQIEEDEQDAAPSHEELLRGLVFELACRFNCKMLSDEHIMLLFETTMIELQLASEYISMYHLPALLSVGDRLKIISDEQLRALNEIVLEHLDGGAINEDSVFEAKCVSKLGKIFGERLKPFVPGYKNALLNATHQVGPFGTLPRSYYVNLAYRAGVAEALEELKFDSASERPLILVLCGKVYVEATGNDPKKCKEWVPELFEMAQDLPVVGPPVSKYEYKQEYYEEEQAFRLMLRLVQQLDDDFDDFGYILEWTKSVYKTKQLKFKANEFAGLLFLKRKVKPKEELNVLAAHEAAFEMLDCLRGHLRPPFSEKTFQVVKQFFEQELYSIKELDLIPFAIYPLVTIIIRVYHFSHTFKGADELLLDSVKYLLSLATTKSSFELLSVGAMNMFHISFKYKLTHNTLTCLAALVSSYFGLQEMKRFLQHTITRTLGTSIITPQALRDLAITTYNTRPATDPFKPFIRKMIILCSVCAIDSMFEEASLSNNDVKVNLPLNENGEEQRVDTGVDEINQMMPNKINGLTFGELLDTQLGTSEQADCNRSFLVSREKVYLIE